MSIFRPFFQFRRLFVTSLFLAILANVSFLTTASAQVSGGRLPTRWDADVSPTAPWPEYPRPQMVREEWASLNGPWEFGLTDSGATTTPTVYSGKILVPFCYESGLSGVGEHGSIPAQRLWYRRTFTVPSSWSGEHVLLHFGAVSWDSSVVVNGKPVGTNRGCFNSFNYDITSDLKPGDNELIVSAWNPVTTSGSDAEITGKQRLHSEGYAYTAATGIWQTVWLEPVAASHITSLKITPDIDSGTVTVSADASGAGMVKVVAVDGTAQVASGTAPAGSPISLSIPSPHLWSPSDPHLYDLKVTLVDGGKTVDHVGSYFAMRKVSLGKDDQGHARILLNNKFLLQIGMLDQGYWPDGIYTAPTDDAMRYDIDTAKKLGFNLLRKHAKVEPQRWYYYADKLGMLVWQDMPQSFGSNLSDDAKAQWITEWKREIAALYNHPSIIVWTPFNEGWGQHDTVQIAALTKQLDPTRLVNASSGGDSMGSGDINDRHDYPGPGSWDPEPARAVVNGEFGGITMLVKGHRWGTDWVGYGTMDHNSWQVDRDYQKLLKAAYALSQDHATSAFVYTQITDVEAESNGIMTYDRAVIKGDPQFITASNAGNFLPLPPNPFKSTDIVPTSEDDPQPWKYVTAKPADDWATSGFDDSSWRSGNAPFGQGYPVNTAWTDTPGDIWLRRTVTLPDSIPPTLFIKTIHDEDVEVYVNGVLAASAPGYVGSYVTLPMSSAAIAALKPGANLIAVHCHQTTGGQVIDVGITTQGDQG